MKWHDAFAWFTLAVSVAAVGCSQCSSTATATEVEPRSRDFIRLDPGNPRLAYIKVEVVRESDTRPSLHLTGRVALDEDHTQRLASPIDGRVVKILAQLGDTVKKDQPLVELSSARVAEIETDGQKAEQDLALARKSLERAQKLMQEGAVSEKDLAQLGADFEKTKANAARVTAQLRSLNLGPSGPGLLRAQIGGTVVERSIFVGQEVRADAVSPLLTITNLVSVWVLADVYEQDLGMVGRGASVTIRVPAYPSETFVGTVDHVGEVLDALTRTVKVRCVVPNSDLRLKPEMFAKIDLAATGRRTGIVVPARAILTDSEHSRIIVASEGNVFRQRIVEVGPEVDGQVTVASGINPGDKIVTSGAIFLRREMASD
ncbi:MAG TPA: efflux RND transporter periplasmic adaptor subunit [Polyangiaceae bacterium]|nr:efflux RND transporter periplasmic adaptor subunit [Polyangiaceae bacterium]